jgi:hypothetical protein
MDRVITDGLPELLAAAGVAPGLPYRVLVVSGADRRRPALIGWPDALAESEFGYTTPPKAVLHPWRGGAFDVALCLDVLDRVGLWECLLANLARALYERDGGTQALAVRCRATGGSGGRVTLSELSRVLREYFRDSRAVLRREDGMLFGWGRGVKSPGK